MMENKKNYLYFLVSDLLSQFGAGMIMSALSWFIISTFGSNQLLAMIVNVNTLSGLVVSFIVGSFIDKFSAKNMVICSHLIRLFLILFPILMMNDNSSGNLFLFIIALSNGLGWNVYYPSSKSLIRSISNNSDLIKINSGAEITMQIGLFSSGAIAGTLYRFVGFKNILILGGILFILAIISTILIDVTEQRVTERNERIFTLFKGGFFYLFSEKKIFVYGIILYIPFIGANIFNVAFPGYVSNTLQQNSTIFGIIGMFYGIGACFAGILVLGLVKKFSIKILVTALFSIGIVGGLLFYVNKSVLFAIFLTFIIGFCGPAIRTIINTIIMENVPEEFIGRVMSIWNMLSLLVQTIITFILGMVMDGYGSQWGFLIYSLLMFIGLSIFAFMCRKGVRHENNSNNESLEG